MLTFPVPATLDGAALAAAIGVNDLAVSVAGDELHIDLPDSERDRVETIVAAHVPPPPPADPDDELRAAIEAATDLPSLKAALLGTNRGSVVAARAKARG